MEAIRCHSSAIIAKNNQSIYFKIMPTKKKRNYLISAMGCRCPRCREGKLFKNNISVSLKKNMAMHKNCLVCGQPTEKEPGFYYGTGYVSYALAVAISVT